LLDRTRGFGRRLVRRRDLAKRRVLGPHGLFGRQFGFRTRFDLLWLEAVERREIDLPSRLRHLLDASLRLSHPWMLEPLLEAIRAAAIVVEHALQRLRARMHAVSCSAVRPRWSTRSARWPRRSRRRRRG